MDFFVGQPEILGGTQTFVATLATLIVLCLFRNEANFLRGIMKSLSLDLESEIIEKLSAFRSDLKERTNPKVISSSLSPTSEEQLAIERDMERELVIYNFFTAAKRERRRYDVIFERFDRREDPRYIAVLMFMAVMIVLTLDCMNVSQEVGSLFLYPTNYMLTISSFVLWAEYAFGGRTMLAPKCLMEKSWSMAVGLFFTFLLLACYMSLYMVAISQGIRLLILLVISVVIALWMHNLFAYIRSKHWMGYKSVVKYGVLLTIVCITASVWLYYAKTSSWLCERVDVEIYRLLIGWTERTAFMSDSIVQMRVWFVLLCIADTFVASLFIAYAYNKVNQWLILRKISNLYQTANSQISKIWTEVNADSIEGKPERDRSTKHRKNVKAKRKKRKSKPHHSIILWFMNLIS